MQTLMGCQKKRLQRFVASLPMVDKSIRVHEGLVQGCVPVGCSASRIAVPQIEAYTLGNCFARWSCSLPNISQWGSSPGGFKSSNISVLER